MCTKIQIKVCIFLDESILNLIYVTEKTFITRNGSLIQKFLTVKWTFHIKAEERMTAVLIYNNQQIYIVVFRFITGKNESSIRLIFLPNIALYRIPRYSSVINVVISSCHTQQSRIPRFEINLRYFPTR